MFARVLIGVKEQEATRLQLEVRLEFVFTIERVAQVDLVSQGVAQLDAHKLSVPRPFHVLLPIAFRVAVRLKWELRPEGVFSCSK